MAYLKILAVGILALVLYLLTAKALVIALVSLLRGHAFPIFAALGGLVFITACYWEYRRVRPNRA